MSEKLSRQYSLNAAKLCEAIERAMEERTMLEATGEAGDSPLVVEVPVGTVDNNVILLSILPVGHSDTSQGEQWMWTGVEAGDTAIIGEYEHVNTTIH